MSQHDTLTLEPCPFCGGSAKFHADQGFSAFLRVKCTSCGSSGPVITYSITENGIDHDSCESRYVPPNYRKSEAARPWNAWRAALSATQPAQAAQGAGEVVAADNERLRTALRFYARGEHFNTDDEDDFDTVSGEPANWLHSGRDGSTTMIEDGSIACFALRGEAIKWIDGDEDDTPQPIDGEAYTPAQPAPVVPEGWKLVPVEPTDEMVVAFAEEWYSHAQTIDDPQMAEAYRAMLAATHTPPAQAADSAFTKALEIRTAQGWKLTGEAIPVLYTDTINDQQVMRDDVWICTTAALKPAQAAADARDAERLEFLYADRTTESNALAVLEVRMLNNDYPTLDEVRAAIDAAIAASGRKS